MATVPHCFIVHNGCVDAYVSKGCYLYRVSP